MTVFKIYDKTIFYSQPDICKQRTSQGVLMSLLTPGVRLQIMFMCNTRKHFIYRGIKTDIHFAMHPSNLKVLVVTYDCYLQILMRNHVVTLCLGHDGILLYGISN